MYINNFVAKIKRIMHTNIQLISHSYAMHRGDRSDSELNYATFDQ